MSPQYSCPATPNPAQTHMQNSGDNGNGGTIERIGPLPPPSNIHESKYVLCPYHELMKEQISFEAFQDPTILEVFTSAGIGLGTTRRFVRTYGLSSQEF